MKWNAGMGAMPGMLENADFEQFVDDAPEKNNYILISINIYNFPIS